MLSFKHNILIPIDLFYEKLIGATVVTTERSAGAFDLSRKGQ
jgi:hypothetical protein